MADKRFNFAPIRPGFPWSITLRLPSTPALFPEGVRLRAQFRFDADSPALVTLTTENGGLTRVDDERVLVALDPASSQRMKSLDAVQFELARTDLEPSRHLGVRVSVKVRPPITAAR